MLQAGSPGGSDTGPGIHVIVPAGRRAGGWGRQAGRQALIRQAGRQALRQAGIAGKAGGQAAEHSGRAPCFHNSSDAYSLSMACRGPFLTVGTESGPRNAPCARGAPRVPSGAQAHCHVQCAPPPWTRGAHRKPVIARETFLPPGSWLVLASLACTRLRIRRDLGSGSRYSVGGEAAQGILHKWGSRALSSPLCC